MEEANARGKFKGQLNNVLAALDRARLTGALEGEALMTVGHAATAVPSVSFVI